MYTIQAMVPEAVESLAYPLHESISSDWEDVATVPAADTDREELDDARKSAEALRKFYTQVRIVKWGPGGLAGEVMS